MHRRPTHTHTTHTCTTHTRAMHLIIQGIDSKVRLTHKRLRIAQKVGVRHVQVGLLHVDEALHETLGGRLLLLQVRDDHICHELPQARESRK